MTDDDAARRRQIEATFADATAVGEATSVLSPSGRYRLGIQRYRRDSSQWDYACGTVVRVADGAVICELKRNIGSFPHTFVTKGATEYLIAGRSYTSQTIVDLDARREYEPPGPQYSDGGFCWSQCFLSPDGNTLAVDGCVWGAPYQFCFFDFTDPARGWPALALEGIARLEFPCDVEPSRWLPDGTFECNLAPDVAEPEERVMLARRGDTMHVVSHWISDAERARRAAEAASLAE